MRPKEFKQTSMLTCSIMRVCHLFISPGHNFFGRPGQPAGEHPLLAVEQIECVPRRGSRAVQEFAADCLREKIVKRWKVPATEAPCFANWNRPEDLEV